MTTHELRLKAAELLSSPERWSGGDHALHHDGYGNRARQTACLVGALAAAEKGHKDYGRIPSPDVHPLTFEAIHEMGFYHEGEAADFNDTHTFEEVRERLIL